MSPNSSPPVRFHDLEVAYGTNVILHGVSATIDKGSCVAITGSNASGKSTLVKALLGIAPIVAGTAELFGCVVRHWDQGSPDIPWARIGYVPQRATVGGGISSTVREVVETGLLGPRQWWIPRGGRTRVQEAIERVGLSYRQHDAFRVLSGGQQQRVLIARALVRAPDLLILDEPLTGLDRHNRQSLADVIREHREQGKTSLIVLHELGELEPYIDRELQVSAGHIVYDGPRPHGARDVVQPHHNTPPYETNPPAIVVAPFEK